MISVIRSNGKGKIKFEIPVKYEVQSVAVGYANSLEQAIQRLLHSEHKLPDGYVYGTLEIDYDSLESGSA